MKFITGVSILVIGLVLMVVNSSTKASQVHYPLEQFYQKIEQTPDALEHKNITIYGYVKEGSIQKKGIQASFMVIPKNTDQNSNNKNVLPALQVFFNGKTLLPDTFKDGAQVSVDGHYNHETKIFESHKVLAKCASRYESTYKKANTY